MVANKPLEILLTIFSTVEKEVPNGTNKNYATKISVTYLTVTITVDPGICESFNLIVDHAPDTNHTAATIQRYWPDL